MYKFNKPTGNYEVGSNAESYGIFQCIAFMDNRKKRSLKELRPKHYQQLKKNATSGVVKSGTPVAFTPTRITDINAIMKDDLWTDLVYARLQCITCMEFYEKNSFEELRLEDYYPYLTVFDNVTTLQGLDSISSVAETKNTTWKKGEQDICSKQNLHSDNETPLIVTSAESLAITEKKNLKLVDPDCEKGVENIKPLYDEQYIKSYLVFYEGTYCQDESTVKYRFIFLVYLLNNEIQDINQWCRKILGHSELTQQIHSRVVFWACDVPSGDDSKLAKVLKASTCSFRNVFVVNDLTNSPGYQMKDLWFLLEFPKLAANLPENILERYTTIRSKVMQARNALLAVHNCECGTKCRTEQLLGNESFAKALTAFQERHCKSENEYKIRQEEGAEITQELVEKETHIESIEFEKELNAEKVALESISSAVDHESVIESGKTELTQHQQNKVREEAFLVHIGRNVWKTFEKNLKYFIVREVFFNYFF